MFCVVDASAVLAWIISDESPDDSMIALLGQVVNYGAIAPNLIWYEINSGLMSAERRKRSDSAQTNASLAALEVMPITSYPLMSHGDVLALARRHGLSSYDASYLELALHYQLPLATLDKKLAAAAMAQGVNVLA